MRKRRPRTVQAKSTTTPFGEWLRAERDSRGDTLESVAYRMNSSPPVLSNLERGSRNPSRKMVGRIVAALLGDEADPRASGRLLSAGLLAAGLAPTPSVTEESKFPAVLYQFWLDNPEETDRYLVPLAERLSRDRALGAMGDPQTSPSRTIDRRQGDRRANKDED